MSRYFLCIFHTLQVNQALLITNSTDTSDPKKINYRVSINIFTIRLPDIKLIKIGKNRM